MRERATLKLDAGDELRVEVERDELSRDEIVVRRASDNRSAATDGLLAVSMSISRPQSLISRGRPIGC